jgi:hypothetical protein
MRYLPLLFIVAACGSTKPREPDPSPPPATAPEPAKAATDLVNSHIWLLTPDQIAAPRTGDIKEFAELLKAAGKAVIDHDASHPGELPAQVDVVIVARPGGVRVWLVGETGDITSPALAGVLAQLPVIAMKGGPVAAVVSLARGGDSSTGRAPFLPASWRAQLGPGGRPTDEVIKAVWP